MEKYQKEFPLVKTKTKGLSQKFDLSDASQRKKYFNLKAGPEISLLRKYLKNNTFIAYFLGKKNSGKGTYAKLMMEIFGQNKIGHISVGDLVRAAHQDIRDKNRKKKLIDYLTNNYRGYISVKQAVDTLLSRDTKSLSLLPTEFILALIKKEIDKTERKSLFIDGFPRNLDQVSYSLFFRDLINYRTDPDVFVIIDIPETVIDERMKYRVVCPKCHTPRNLKLLPTKEIAYDQTKKRFYLVCDNPDCQKAKMIGKEGDDLGIESIRGRLETDDQLIEKVFSLHGISKVLLKNTLPVDSAEKYVDDYEITPQYSYQFDAKTKQIKILEKPWIVRDDQKTKVYSLLSPPVAVALMKQLVKVLGL